MKRTLSLLLLILTLALPARAQSTVGPDPDNLPACTDYVWYFGNLSGGIGMWPGKAAQSIYVCGFNFWSNGTVNLGLVYGTGSTCSTGTTKITPAFQFAAQTGLTDHPPIYEGLLPIPPGNNLCLNASGAVSAQAIVYFGQW